MEYWRRKRLEPRIIRLIRKGTIAFPDLIEASEAARSRLEKLESKSNLENRVAALEIGLGRFVRGIEVATSIIGSRVLVEESRQEAGVYDDEVKLAHRKLGGGATERVGQVDELLAAPNPPRFENGARIVAKAWLDPEFRRRLLSDAKTTLRELGFALNRTPKLVVLEDTASVRHVIVCTLCSCYPYELLGNPPWWYKQDRYKQ